MAVLLWMAGCASAPKPAARARPVELTSASIAIAEQDMTKVTLRLDAEVAGAPGAKISAARYEWVSDGRVVFARETPLDVTLTGEATPLSFEATGEVPVVFGQSLVALRGELVVDDGEARTGVPFARSLELRPPRPLLVRLKDYDAGRYANDEANVIFYVGVDNPNPFLVRLGGLEFQADIDGRALEQGTVGRADPIAPTSTGIYEVQVELRKDTYGPEVGKLLRAGKVPYRIHGRLLFGEHAQPFSISGEIRLGGSR